MWGLKIPGEAAADDKPAEPGLTELLRAVNETAVTSRNIVTALLATAITLAATIIASSDEAILRDTLQAPFSISASVRLSTAYALMPPVFLFLHINALLQLKLLKERLDAFKAAIPTATERDWWRCLHGLAFVQSWIGDDTGDRLRDRLYRCLLTTVGFTSIALVPLGLLFLTQISFLRYQSESITWLHRVIVTVDIVLLFWFSRVLQPLSPMRRTRVARFFHRRSQLHRRSRKANGRVAESLRRWMSATALSVNHPLQRPGYLAFGLIFWVLAWTQATVPTGDEPGCQVRWDWRASIAYWTPETNQSRPADIATSADDATPADVAKYLAEEQLAMTRRSARSERWSFGSFVDLVFLPAFGLGYTECPQLINRRSQPPIVGEPIPDTPSTPERDPNNWPIGRANVFDRWTCSQWRLACRYLDLHDQVFLNASSTPTSIDVFTADPVERETAKSRMLGLNLRERNLRFADLQSTTLLGADLRGADLTKIQAESANLQHSLTSETTRLIEADLRKARLQKTNLTGSRFEGADLTEAWMQGANLANALLQGANLRGARLQGANLEGARMTGAVLDRAKLQMASLDSATLEGATIIGANLSGTSLYGATLLGSDFAGSRLLFADLAYSDLSGVQLTGADARGAFTSFPLPSQCARANGAQMEQAADLARRIMELDRVSEPTIRKTIIQIRGADWQCTGRPPYDQDAAGFGKSILEFACHSTESADQILDRAFQFKHYLSFNEESQGNQQQGFFLTDPMWARQTLQALSEALKQTEATQEKCPGLILKKPELQIAVDELIKAIR
jgi:uncharacterized protein YjbI with pentapeptide repeats